MSHLLQNSIGDMIITMSKTTQHIFTLQGITGMIVKCPYRDTNPLVWPVYLLENDKNKQTA